MAIYFGSNETEFNIEGIKKIIYNSKTYYEKSSVLTSPNIMLTHLCFIAKEDEGCIISGSINGTLDNEINLVYSIDGINWNTFLKGNTGDSVNVKLNKRGDKVYIKNNNNTLSSGLENNYFYFKLNDNLVGASGDVMSLINYQNVSVNCFSHLFYNCSSLTTIPEIENTFILAEGCYYKMFYNCINITTAPQLQGVNIPNNAYSSMFENCINLKIKKGEDGTPFFNYKSLQAGASISNMFLNTDGSFKGTPTVGNIYSYYF